MNQEQLINERQSSSETPAQSPVKLAYHAPQVKIHGKLERMTLQTGTSPVDTNPGAGGSEGGGL